MVSGVGILVLDNSDIRAEKIIFELPVLFNGEILLNNELNLSTTNEIKDPCSVVIAEEESSLSIKKSIESHPSCEK